MTQTIRERRGQIAVTVASRHIWSLALARLLVAYCWLYSYPICLPTNFLYAIMIGPLSAQPDLLLATTLGTTSSQTADRIHDVPYGYHFFPSIFICIVFQLLFVWRECLVHQVHIVLTVLSFRFSGLCLMVVNATIRPSITGWFLVFSSIASQPVAR